MKSQAIKFFLVELTDFDKDKPPGTIEIMEDVKQGKEASMHEKNSANTIPLLQLIKQLLKNSSSLTQSKLQALATSGGDPPTFNSFINKEKPERSPSLNLLLRFQRLLVCQIYPRNSEEKSVLGRFVFNNSNTVIFLY